MPSLGLAGAQADPPRKPVITKIGGGMIRIEVPGGPIVVGGPGTQVESVTDNAGELVAITVAANSDDDLRAQAEAYRSQGRSTLRTARASGMSAAALERLSRHLSSVSAGGDPSDAAQARTGIPWRAPTATSVATSGSGNIYDSICINDTSDKLEWDGCVTRYRSNDSDPDYNYGIDDAYASGHETHWYPTFDLEKGAVKNIYNTSQVNLTKMSPGADINDVNHCYSVSLGGSAAGFGVSGGGTVCPDRWDITRDTDGAVRSHKVEWQGETNDDREAAGITSWRVKVGTGGTKYAFNISAYATG